MTPSRLPEPSYCVVMHDVAPPTWPQCKKLLAALREVTSFPATLLLVPRYHHTAPAALDAEFCSTMSRCQSDGDELVLHGLYHQDDVPTAGTMDLLKRQIYTAGEGEFATLPEEEAARRIHEGLSWFAAEGFTASGFVAPAWLASPGTWQALKATPLQYSTTLSGLHLLKDGTRLKAQSLVFSSRSGLRRLVSHVVAEAVAVHLRRAPLVRFGLHPIDADYPVVVRHWQSLLERFARTHRPTTKRDFVSALQSV